MCICIVPIQSIFVLTHRSVNRTHSNQFCEIFTICLLISSLYLKYKNHFKKNSPCVCFAFHSVALDFRRKRSSNYPPLVLRFFKCLIICEFKNKTKHPNKLVRKSCWKQKSYRLLQDTNITGP